MDIDRSDGLSSTVSVFLRPSYTAPFHCHDAAATESIETFDSLKRRRFCWIFRCFVENGRVLLKSRLAQNGSKNTGGNTALVGSYEGARYTEEPQLISEHGPGFELDACQILKEGHSGVFCLSPFVANSLWLEKPGILFEQELSRPCRIDIQPQSRRFQKIDH